VSYEIGTIATSSITTEKSIIDYCTVNQAIITMNARPGLSTARCLSHRHIVVEERNEDFSESDNSLLNEGGAPGGNLSIAMGNPLNEPLLGGASHVNLMVPSAHIHGRNVSDLSCGVNEDGTAAPDDQFILPQGVDVSFRDKCCEVRSDKVYLYMIFLVKPLAATRSANITYKSILHGKNEASLMASEENHKQQDSPQEVASVVYVVLNKHDLDLDLIDKFERTGNGYKAQLKDISPTAFHDISKCVAEIANADLVDTCSVPRDVSVLVLDDLSKEFYNVALSRGASSLDSTWRSLNVKFSGLQATILLMLLLWESWTCDGFAHGICLKYLIFLFGFVFVGELSYVNLNVSLFVQGVRDANAFSLMANSRDDCKYSQCASYDSTLPHALGTFFYHVYVVALIYV
jgi:hypothetical protein